jgi:hypothetical protein
MVISLAMVDQVFIREDNTDNTYKTDRKLQSLDKNYAAIVNQIEILRQHLEDLVISKNNLTDPDVLAASQALDEALNKFYRVLSLIVDNTNV